MSRADANVAVLSTPQPVELAIERRSRSRDALIQRIRAEYGEMPGLSLTLPQAALLFGLSQPTCARVLRSLVQARFLRRTPSGRFVMSDAAPGA